MLYLWNFSAAACLLHSYFSTMLTLCDKLVHFCLLVSNFTCLFSKLQNLKKHSASQPYPNSHSPCEQNFYKTYILIEKLNRKTKLADESVFKCPDAIMNVATF